MRVALLFVLAVALGAPAAAVAARRSPVVVELYTSQGCGSCPQADQILAGLAQRKHVIALTFPVDYWDYLGWRDTFAQPEFTARQRAYIARMRLREIYTPEIVVDGRREAPGLDKDKIDDLIAKEEHAPADDPPDIRFARHARRVEVGSGERPRGGGEVWLVRYDPREQDVKVKAGDNKGKLVVQRNVVRELIRLGSWIGRPRSYRMPKPTADGLRTVVLVQAARGGAILAAQRD